MGTRSCVATIGTQLTAVISNLLDASSTGTPQASLGKASTQAIIQSGTGAGQANRFWSDRGRTLESAATETLDLYDFAGIDVGAGAAKDALGQDMVLADIVAIIVEVTAASAGTLLVGGDGTAAAWNSPFNGDDAAVMPVFPGGLILLYAPTDPAYAVADASNHLLKFTASGGAVEYDIHILGRSS